MTLLLGVAAPSTGHTDNLCPLGWNCAPILDFGRGPIVDSGTDTPICTIQRAAAVPDRNVAINVTSAVVNQTSTVEFSFIVDLYRFNGDKRLELVELNTARIFSHDRVLDTRLWRQTVVAGSNRLVLTAFLDADKPVARSAFHIAAGELFGLIIETRSGELLRFELDRKSQRTESDRQIISTFKECVLRNRLPDPESSNRG